MINPLIPNLVEIPSCLLLWLVCLVVPNCIHAHPLRLSDAIVSKSESNNARDLVHFLNGFFAPASLQEKHNRLNVTDNSEDKSEPNHPPIGRRLIEVSCLIIGGFFLGLRGWENLDNNRKLIRATFIGGWLVLSICGWLLWFITFYRWTWSWWL